MIGKIVKIIFFVTLSVLMFVTLSYVFRPHDGDPVYIKTYGMQPSNSIDVVYFGGSSVLTYWAPMDAWEKYGFTSYNFANSAMPAQLEKYCIIEALKKQSPELIIVDVRPFEYGEELEELAGDISHLMMYGEPYIRNFVDNFRYSPNRANAIENSVPKENNRLNYHLDIAKYHTNYQALTQVNNWKYALYMPDDNTKYFGGFRPVIRYASIERTDNKDITDELPLSNNLDLIYRDLLSYCEGLDANVLFIVPPYAESEENHKKHNYMKRIAAEYEIQFVDCNDIFEETGLDVDTDFYDPNHLQIFGAKKYTEWLGQYLVNEYSLPDRRGSLEYKDWEIAYDLWAIKSTEIEDAVFELMPSEIQSEVAEKKR